MSDPKLDQLDIEAQWLSVFKTYARDQLYVNPMPDIKDKSMSGMQLQKFELNAPQTLLDQIIDEIRAEGRLVRIVILKARREGMSTYVSGRFYWMTTTRWNRYSLLITHEPEATEFLFQMHKRFLQNNPVWRPSTTYNNKKLLNFDTPDGKGLGSAIRVATAGKEDIGSGQTVHYLHLSEMAKWPAHTSQAIMNSVSQCVPNAIDSEVIIESTAKGIGGEFYTRYNACRYIYEIKLVDGKPTIFKREDKTKDNEYNSVFFPWFVFEKYTIPAPANFVRTPKEEEMAELYGINNNHLAWRRWCIANNCAGNEDVFAQEYPSNPDEAFLGSGDNAFDNSKLQKLIATAPDPTSTYDINISDGQFIAKPLGNLKVWEEPITGEEYVVSGDVAEGINRNASGKIADYSCAQVWKCSTGEQVAEWHGKIDADHFGLIMAYLGRRYNTAWLVPERNNHGNSTVLKLVDIRYPRIYVERVPEPPNQFRKRYGWLTSRQNKRDIVDNFVAELRDDTHGIKSVETLREMLSFKKDGENYGAAVGKFDDRVMAALIGKHTIPMLRSRRVRRDATQTYRDTNSATSTTAHPTAWMV